MAEMLRGGSDCCNSLCRVVWVSGNQIGAEGVRYLVDGFAAAGLSQLTSLSLRGELGNLLSWDGSGCCCAGCMDGAVAEAVRCEDGWLAEMLGGILPLVTHCAVLFGFQ